MRAIHLTALLLLVVAPGWTAADEASQAMERLQPLAGNYRIEGQRHAPDGPIKLTATQATIAYTLNRRALREDASVDMGLEQPVTLLTYFSYDEYRQVYRIAVMDDAFGLMDIYEGRFVDDATLIATNLRSDTHFPTADDGRLHFQLRWYLGGDVKQFDVLASTDGGASWTPYFEMTYTPV